VISPPADELQALLALTCTPRVGRLLARRLVETLGTASAVYAHRAELPDIVPGVRPSLLQALDSPDAWQRAQAEADFISRHQIRALTLHDAAYPSRLRECDDAPLVLYTLGTANLNAAHVVGIVGTRKATERGRDLCTAFVRDLAAALPDVLIVSGLAYGIDVASHRASLSSHASTVGVLAHGLDRIYPSAHRSVAAQMTAQGGGLVTEYMSQSEPERQNFVQRNRIIAGMSDAVVVVESAAKGGALITADYAQGYNRDCFAFPGRVDDPYSCGCNNLIRSNAAALITSAADFLKAMDWAPLPDAGKPVQRQIFVELSPDEERILACLCEADDGLPMDMLSMDTDIPAGRLGTLLFQLEMKGLVRTLGGTRYQAIR
jgi:DNA protecting protein DprA